MNDNTQKSSSTLTKACKAIYIGGFLLLACVWFLLGQTERKSFSDRALTEAERVWKDQTENYDHGSVTLVPTCDSSVAPIDLRLLKKPFSVHPATLKKILRDQQGGNGVLDAVCLSETPVTIHDLYKIILEGEKVFTNHYTILIHETVGKPGVLVGTNLTAVAMYNRNELTTLPTLLDLIVKIWNRNITEPFTFNPDMHWHLTFINSYNTSYPARNSESYMKRKLINVVRKLRPAVTMSVYISKMDVASLDELLLNDTLTTGFLEATFDRHIKTPTYEGKGYRPSIINSFIWFERFPRTSVSRPITVQINEKVSLLLCDVDIESSGGEADQRMNLCLGAVVAQLRSVLHLPAVDLLEYLRGDVLPLVETVSHQNTHRLQDNVTIIETSGRIVSSNPSNTASVNPINLRAAFVVPTADGCSLWEARGIKKALILHLTNESLIHLRVLVNEIRGRKTFTVDERLSSDIQTFSERLLTDITAFSSVLELDPQQGYAHVVDTFRGIEAIRLHENIGNVLESDVLYDLMMYFPFLFPTLSMAWKIIRHKEPPDSESSIPSESITAVIESSS